MDDSRGGHPRIFKSKTGLDSNSFIESKVITGLENIDPSLINKAQASISTQGQKKRYIIKSGSFGKLDMKPLAQKEINMENSTVFECEIPTKSN